ncbi:MAG TPA: hypothetical protein PLL80_01275 [Candidatus Pacearchaeota archaeon]|nr:hypothetical protein [Candidatus Pacearchaeota archaeon]HOK94099.1 hypothetical protein [Candidatus Pacearchaeota archaeon]HPO75227.1 hypothetical protein [Candidatus Pacearchaeota archaeon]
MEKHIDLQKKETSPEPQETLFKWKYKKEDEIDKKWQIGITSFLIICMALFLWQKNYFGAALVAVIIFLIFFFPRQSKEQSFAIIERGIKIENELFPWKNLESFWIFEEPVEVYIKNKKNFPSYISLPLYKRDIIRVKNILLNYLPEKEAQRNAFDTIGKKLGL